MLGAGHHVQSVMSGCELVDAFFCSVVAFMLQTFQSVSIRRLVAMTENIRINVEYHSVPDGGATMAYQFIPWAAASVMSINQILAPFTVDEIEEIVINGTRVRHDVDFDGRRTFVRQFALIPINYDVHIYLDVYVADERNVDEDDDDDDDEGNIGEVYRGYDSTSCGTSTPDDDDYDDDYDDQFFTI